MQQRNPEALLRRLEWTVIRRLDGLLQGDYRTLFRGFGLKGLEKYLTYGASPRASIHLIEAARALAFLRGRDYALPEDVTALVPDVLRHRLVLSYEALAEGLSPDQLIQRIMQQVRAPEKPMQAGANAAAQS